MGAFQIFYERCYWEQLSLVTVGSLISTASPSIRPTTCSVDRLSNKFSRHGISVLAALRKSLQNQDRQRAISDNGLMPP